MRKTIICLTFILMFLTSCGNKRQTINVKNSAISKGWVMVQFTINKTGIVESPVVIDSDPKGIFDKEAIQAILKYKFKRRYKKGKAVEVKATQIIYFKLAE